MAAEDLIRRFQQGQEYAFEALFTRYKDYVYRIAFAFTRNSGDAEEIVQETFLDVLRALPRYRLDGPASFETWLYRVTVNRCRKLARRQRPPSADWDAIAEHLEAIPNGRPYHNPEAASAQAEASRGIWEAVDALPEPFREVIILRYLEDLSYKDIAQVLDISEGTVKSRLYTAHRRLQEALAINGRVVTEIAGRSKSRQVTIGSWLL